MIDFVFAAIVVFALVHVVFAAALLAFFGCLCLAGWNVLIRLWED